MRYFAALALYSPVMVPIDSSATLPSGSPEAEKAARYRRSAYMYHKALAVVVSVNFVMALSAFHEPADVVGGYGFMFITLFGAPLLFLFCASSYYSFRARSEWRLVVLSAVASAMVVLAVLGIEPNLKSLVMDCVYVVSVVFFLVFNGKRKRETLSGKLETETGSGENAR